MRSSFLLRLCRCLSKSAASCLTTLLFSSEDLDNEEQVVKETEGDESMESGETSVMVAGCCWDSESWVLIAAEDESWEAAGLESAEIENLLDDLGLRAGIVDSISTSFEWRLPLIASEAVQKPEVVIEVASIESADDSPSETSMDDTEDVSEFLDLLATFSLHSVLIKSHSAEID